MRYEEIGEYALLCPLRAGTLRRRRACMTDLVVSKGCQTVILSQCHLLGLG